MAELRLEGIVELKRKQADLRRQERAIQMALDGVEVQPVHRDLWKVQNSAKDGWYYVKRVFNSGSVEYKCNCPDKANREIHECKHAKRVHIWEEMEREAE